MWPNPTNKRSIKTYLNSFPANKHQITPGHLLDLSPQQRGIRAVHCIQPSFELYHTSINALFPSALGKEKVGALRYDDDLGHGSRKRTAWMHVYGEVVDAGVGYTDGAQLECGVEDGKDGARIACVVVGFV